MGWQPGQDDDPGTAAPGPARDPRLTGFARDGEWDASCPSTALAAVVEDVSGPEWRCPGATRDEMLGLLRQAQALESWTVATKLGILRALIRDDDEPLPGGGYHGDLPEGWTKSLTHEVALALSMPAVSADKLMWAAWDLQARIPGTGDLLATGDLTYAKAKAVHEAFLLLDDEDAASAEAMILPELPGKTYGEVKRLAEQAAIAVDPESAARRREHAERNRARVEMSREDSGAAALSGRDLPTGQALAAHAHVCARAQEYKESGAFPDDARMDQFRAAAYLDLLNGKPTGERIAAGQLDTAARTAATEAGRTEAPDARESRGDDVAVPANGVPGSDDSPDDGGPSAGGPGDQGSGGPRGDAGSPGSPGLPGGNGSANATPPRLVDLVLPLTTLLGLAERPGEGHGLGPLDPELCRNLAAVAIGSPWTRLCVTVTDPEGFAIGHGCGKPPRNAKTRTSGRAEQPASLLPGTRTRLALPSQANLTVTATRLAELGAAGPPATPNKPRPPGQPPWSFTRASDPGPPGGYGTWTLTLPDGRNLTVALEPMPTFECDHRHESRAYEPNDTLRHLVQVRDYTCTFPPCNRHARESDFEHAVPYDQGGRTCACNAGARSRRLPPGETVERVERHPAQTGLARMASPIRAYLHPATEALPHLIAAPVPG